MITSPTKINSIDKVEYDEYLDHYLVYFKNEPDIFREFTSLEYKELKERISSN